uniref:GLOBIN domain-containing protein n=1 Tax=Strongyloides venezuelensis TaxID=75913 RepID=A0A0K0FQN6_STRVS
MLRIMEAIQRRKLIQLLNDEYKHDMVHDGQETTDGVINYTSPPKVFGKQNAIDYDNIPHITTPSLTNASKKFPKNIINEDLQKFIESLEYKLTDLQKKALRITWKKMSEAPRTSSKGMLCIMEKIFDKMISENPEISNVFYRSAFLSCIEDRKKMKIFKNENSDTEKCPFKKKTIATLRDHANILLDFVNTIMAHMYNIPYKQTYTYKLTSLGCSHAKLTPLGFDRNWFHKLGECFAEVMFSQESIRAFPHAPNAWSIFAVSLTEKLYVESKWKKCDNYHKVQRPLQSSYTFSDSPYDNNTSTDNKRKLPSSSKSMYQIEDKYDDTDQESEIYTGRPTKL